MRSVPIVSAIILAILSAVIATAATAQTGVLPPPAPTTERPAGSAGSLPPTAPAPAQPGPPGPDQLSRMKEFGKAPAETGQFPLTEYKFPILINAIFNGRLDDIPDDRATRGLVFTFVKGFTDHCGEAPADVAIQVMPYASDIARKIYSDPVGGGFKVLEEMLRAAATAQRQGVVAGIEEYLRRNGVASQDAYDDAKILIARHGCVGEIQSHFYSNMARLIKSRSSSEPATFDDVKFWALMSPAYRRQNNIPDPAVELARRKTEALKKTALQTCQSSFDRPAFCDCAIRNLGSAGLNDDQWSTLGKNFRSIAVLAKDRTDLHAAARSCY